MRNPYPGLVRILDDKNLKFKCEICRLVWRPSFKRSGRLYRGSRMCPNGCTKRALEAKKIEKLIGE